MSQSLRIHKLFPTNKKTVYSSLENIDFNLSFPNRALVCNSVRIEGTVEIYSDTDVRTVITDDIYVDPLIGANAFIESIQTTAEQKGILENVQNLPRFCKMYNSGSNDPSDMVNISNTSELKSSSLLASKNIFLGNFNADMTEAEALVAEGNSFSIKPYFILNQTSRGESGGSVNLENATMGDIRISLRTTANNASLFGADAGPSCYYLLRDISLVFHSLPSTGTQDKLVMRTKQLIRQSIQSGMGVISVNVPQLTNGVSISFLESVKQNADYYNNVQLDKIPNVEQVEFLINDSPSDFITFQLRSQNEILQNYINSISNSNLNAFSQNAIKSNEAYGIGIPFGDLLDMSKDRFSVNIASELTVPFVCFCYFNGLVFV